MTLTASASPSEGLTHTQRLVRAGPLGALIVELVAAAALLVHYNRPLWFGLDDWAFILGPQMRRDWPAKYFGPHNEHWSTIPILIYRAVYHAVGVTSYLAYAIPMILAHLGICAVLWVLLRRMGIQPWIASGTIAVIAFLGAGAEDLLWSFQVGFLGSVFFGLLAVLTADRRSSLGVADGLVWLWAVLALMCSGIGIPMLVMLFVFAAFRRGWQRALALVSCPVVVYAVWYVGIGHTGTRRDFSDVAQYLSVPAYFWTGLTNAWEKTSGVPDSGALIVAALLVPLLALGVRGRAAQLALAGIAGAATLYLMTGAVRSHLGASQADASRYVYIAIALSAPALAWLADRIYRRAGGLNPAAAIALAVTCALVVVNGVQQIRAQAIPKTEKAIRSHQAMIGAAHIIATGQPFFKHGPSFAPGVNGGTLAQPDAVRAFGHTAPTPQGLLDGAAYIQVDVGDVDHGLSTPESLRWAGVSGSAPTVGLGPRCGSGTISKPGAFVEMGVGPSGSQLTIATSGSRLVTSIRQGQLVSKAVDWTVAPAETEHLASVALGKTVRVALPSTGTVTVCVGG